MDTQYSFVGGIWYVTCCSLTCSTIPGSLSMPSICATQLFAKLCPGRVCAGTIQKLLFLFTLLSEMISRESWRQKSVKYSRVYICCGMVLLKQHQLTNFVEHIYFTVLCALCRYDAAQVIMSLLRHTRIMASTYIYT
jgi:hypothetical protein